MTKNIETNADLIANLEYFESENTTQIANLTTQNNQLNVNIDSMNQSIATLQTQITANQAEMTERNQRELWLAETISMIPTENK